MIDTNIRFPTNDDDPLKFVDYTVLTLLSVRNAHDFNRVLSAFLADDVLIYLGKHRAMFFVLSEVWNETIRRVILDVEDTIFPDGLLAIPPLFHHLDWIENSERWEKCYRRYDRQFEANPNLVDAIVLLFVESMQTSINDALANFAEHIQLLPDSEINQAKEYERLLVESGWAEYAEVA